MRWRDKEKPKPKEEVFLSQWRKKFAWLPVHFEDTKVTIWLEWYEVLYTGWTNTDIAPVESISMRTIEREPEPLDWWH